MRVDDASNDAITEAVQRGWFKKESEEYFDYVYYWATVAEIVEYAEVDWSNAATIPDNVLAESHRLVDAEDVDVKIRIRRAMAIALYRKLG
jgi:hypothetical protein